MTAPAGFPPLFDSHTHLVSADRDRFPLDYQGQPGHVGEALPEGHDPLLQRLIQHPPTLDKMLGWFDDFGVTGGCGVQYRTAYGTDNAYLLHSAKQSPDRIIPVVLIDPRAPETPDAVRRMAAELDEDWSLDGLTRLVYGLPKVLLGLPMDADPTPEVKKAQRGFFIALYSLLVGQDTGPRLPTLLLSLGQEKVRQLLTEPGAAG